MLLESPILVSAISVFTSKNISISLNTSNIITESEISLTNNEPNPCFESASELPAKFLSAYTQPHILGYVFYYIIQLYFSLFIFIRMFYMQSYMQPHFNFAGGVLISLFGGDAMGENDAITSHIPLCVCHHIVCLLVIK